MKKNHEHTAHDVVVFSIPKAANIEWARHMALACVAVRVLELWVTQERLKGRRARAASQAKQRSRSRADFKENDNRHPCSFKYQKPSENPLVHLLVVCNNKPTRVNVRYICPEDTFLAADKAHKNLNSSIEEQTTNFISSFSTLLVKMQLVTSTAQILWNSS